MKELILATHNPGKIKEFQELLHPTRCIPQGELNIEEPEETGLSFIENALIKARHASLNTGKAALADDSGLVVPALKGAPGIYSARYAGINSTSAACIEKLLIDMQNLPATERKAYFYCALALVRHPLDPTPLCATGFFHGCISLEASGLGGFGYDPIFYVPTYQCTAAELPKDIKNTISHRALALKQLLNLLQNTHE